MTEVRLNSIQQMLTSKLKLKMKSDTPAMNVIIFETSHAVSHRHLKLVWSANLWDILGEIN